MPNRLAGETSPYLLQHAHNPVDWYPWGSEALGRAKADDRPIFLSIGYAACHWCHVMERESFEDAATATQLNADFVPIKVDREERPDLDQVYMAAVQAMTGGGGWPMSVFLTPDGRPFYGGTYFPDTPRHGMPAFREVLGGVARAWREQRPEVEASADRLVEALRARNASRSTATEGLESDDARSGQPAGGAGGGGKADGGNGGGGNGGGGPQLRGDDRAVPLHIVVRERMSVLPGRSTFDAAVARLETEFDTRRGGWGGAPKFPQPMTIEFLLRRARAGDGRALAMARLTLDRMADGGIHDQLGGGFHRYSTDARWLVPHFEQMLYDNAELARVYLQAWALAGEDRYREVAEGVLGYLAGSLRRRDGAFASSHDADTGGEEGATFVWTAEEVADVLRDGELGQLFATAYGVTPNGNWEGRTILSRVTPAEALAAAAGMSTDEVERRLGEARRLLLEHRELRPQPARDDKALGAWNGLAIGAFAEAAWLLGGGHDRESRARAETYATIATGAADAILGGLLADGRLRRSWKDGRATGMGVLEDYTHLADGLLALYRATFDERWFATARSLMDVVLERFMDPDGGFFDTADDHEALVSRPKDLQDNALPSGNAMATSVLLSLAALTGEGRYRDVAERSLGLVGSYLSRFPSAFGQWLVALEFGMGAGRRGCSRRRSGCGGNPAIASAGEDRLSSAPGGCRGRRSPGERRAAPAGQVRARRAAYRVRVPRFRMSAASHGARSPGRAAPGGGVGELRCGRSRARIRCWPLAFTTAGRSSFARCDRTSSLRPARSSSPPTATCPLPRATGTSM